MKTAFYFERLSRPEIALDQSGINVKRDQSEKLCYIA